MWSRSRLIDEYWYMYAYVSLKLLNFLLVHYIYFTLSYYNQSNIIDYERREARDTTRIELTE
jgi:hypothetical protein